MKTRSNIRRAGIFLLLLLLIITPLPVRAAEAPVLTAEEEKALIYNLEYDRILWSEGKDESIAPASFTKIMTAVLAFEYWQEHPDAVVTVSKNAVDKSSGTNVNLKAEEILPFEELLYALVVGSANDAALVIAETVAGTEAEFIGMMNAKAKELGMENSYFSNPTGMDQSAMYTTLSDMAKLCAYAYKINDFMVMTNVVDHTVPATNLSKERKLRTKNLLVDPNPYSGYYTKEVMGMNAGSTAKAGFCVATTVEKSGLTYIILISGGKYQNNIYSSFTDAATLVRYASTRYRLTTVLEKDHALSEMKVALAKNADSVMLTCENEVQALLPVDFDEKLLELRMEYVQDVLTAPVSKGLPVGVVRIYYDSQFLGSANIVTQRAVEKSWFESFLASAAAFFNRPTVKAIVKFAIVALILLIILSLVLYILRRRRKNASERRAIHDYLRDDRRRFKEERKEYRENKKQKKKARQATFRRIRNNYHRYKVEKEQDALRAARLAEQRRRAAAQRAQHPPQQPPSPPPPPPPPQRPGDEYYLK